MRADVVVIGGGPIGAAAAYYLRSHAKPCTVAVIERDPTYALASTPRASGGVRRLFSLPENIQLSQYSIPFFERFAITMAVDDEPALIGFKKNGYLFIVPRAAIDTLRANSEAQQREGVRVIWLEPKEIAVKFPSMRVDDLGAGVQSPDDFRPEGKGYSGGVPDLAEPRGFNFEVDHRYFERVVWPALAHRFRAFETTKVRSTMSGLYDQNELDANMIIGPWTGHLENFYLLS